MAALKSPLALKFRLNIRRLSVLRLTLTAAPQPAGVLWDAKALETSMDGGKNRAEIGGDLGAGGELGRGFESGDFGEIAPEQVEWTENFGNHTIKEPGVRRDIPGFDDESWIP